MVLDRAGRLAPQPLVANSGGLSWPTATPNAGGLIARASGRVYFEMGANAYVCSGSVVTDGRTGYSLVLTAAHCVYDHAAGWATYWMFVPQADGLPVVPTCEQSPRGCWTAQALVAHSRFTTAGGFSGTAARYDYAFAVVGPGGHDGATQLDADSPLDADTAPDSFAIAYSGVAKNDLQYAFGYPAAAPYNGTDLVYCSGKIGQDLFNGNGTWSMVCNMTGGASGGPWLRGFAESSGVGTLASLNSYRYSFSNRMYGPKFSSYTQAVYNAANSATAGTIAVP
jgi:V8-like Glu-specific endopeptidase